MSLFGFLGACCLAAGALGPSRVLLALGGVVLIAVEVLRRLRANLDESYQSRFRERVTREWFHTQSRDASSSGAYLAPAPDRDQIPLEVARHLREACARATGQAPLRTSIEERVFSDADSYHSWSFILCERTWTGRAKSRALVWFRALPGSPTDPALNDLRAALRATAGGRIARAFVSQTGVWAAVMLTARPFSAPVSGSCLDPRSYLSWSGDARLLNDPAVVRALLAI